MQSRPTAVFELPDGVRFTLNSSGEWKFDPDTPAAIKEIIELTPSWQHVDPDLRDWDPYIDLIADIASARVIERQRPDVPPADAIF